MSKKTNYLRNAMKWESFPFSLPTFILLELTLLFPCHVAMAAERGRRALDRGIFYDIFFPFFAAFGNNLPSSFFTVWDGRFQAALDTKSHILEIWRRVVWYKFNSVWEDHTVYFRGISKVTKNTKLLKERNSCWAPWLLSRVLTEHFQPGVHLNFKTPTAGVF